MDIMYTKAPEADYIDAAAVTVLQVHATQVRLPVALFAASLQAGCCQAFLVPSLPFIKCC